MTVVDTSIIVATLTLADSSARGDCEAALRSSPTPIAHVLLESFSVLTRLPAPLRVTADQASTHLHEAFPLSPLTLASSEYRDFLSLLSTKQIVGGSTYDALIAFTAKSHSRRLLTRDRRAAATYAAIGADVTFI